MRIILTTFCFATHLSACSSPIEQNTTQAGFITLLGTDTLADEQYSVSENHPEGGTLIVNTPTYQGGTTHNSDWNLERVPRTRTTLDETAEVFTASIAEGKSSDHLQLSRNQSAFSVPVRTN